LNGDIEGTFECYKKLTSVFNEEYSAHFHAGNIFIINGDFEAAIDAYKTANKLHETASAHYQLSKCLMVAHNFSEAVKELELAASIKELPMIKRDLTSLKVLEEFTLAENSKYERFETVFTNMIANCNKEEVEASIIDFEANGNNDYCRLDLENISISPIFEVEDWITYRGAARMYLGKYNEALNDFKEAFNALEDKKEKYFGCDDKDDSEDREFYKEVNDLRFALITFNECRYNQLLCYLLVI